MSDCNPNPTPPLQSSLLVMLVEDEEMVAHLLSLSLQRAGHKVVVAGNGQDALHQMERLQSTVDVLVTDIDLPGMSGLDLAAAAGKKYPGLPVLLISGLPLSREDQAAQPNYLPKPFGPAELLSRVERLANFGPEKAVETSGLPSTAATQAAPRQLRVIAADDNPAFLERLPRLLGEKNRIVGTFHSGATMLDKVRDLNPDLILLDISMPDLGGFSVARRLRMSMPDVPIIFVTQHANFAYVDEARQIGVRGYVLKSHVAQELADAVQQVTAGQSYISARIEGP